MNSEDKGFLELLRRVHLCQRSVGLEVVDWMIFSAFASPGAPWPAKSMAEYVGVPRATLLRALARYQDGGLMTQERSGWALTAAGLDLMKRATLETREIVVGVRAGYSREFMGMVQGIGVRTKPDALTLAFQKPRDSWGG